MWREPLLRSQVALEGLRRGKVRKPPPRVDRDDDTSAAGVDGVALVAQGERVHDARLVQVHECRDVIRLARVLGVAREDARRGRVRDRAVDLNDCGGLAVASVQQAACREETALALEPHGLRHRLDLRMKRE